VNNLFNCGGKLSRMKDPRKLLEFYIENDLDGVIDEISRLC